MQSYARKRHAVYSCTYHMVFVTKYRKPIINDELTEVMGRIIRSLAEGLNGSLLSLESDTDHLHLLVSLPPDVAPKTAVASFKTQTSKWIHADPHLMEHVRKYLYGDCPFWSASYFVASTGSVSMETVKQYIESQRTDAHRRKYEKSGRYRKKSRS